MLIRHGKPLLNDEFAYRDIRIEGDRITEIMPYDSSVPVSYTHLTLPTICSV